MSMKSTYGEPKANYGLKIALKSWSLFLLMVILTLICLFPIVILIVNATRESVDIQNSITLIPGDAFVKNFKTLTQDSNFTSSVNIAYGYLNSAIITVSACALTVFFSALTAYGIQVYEFKMKEISYTIILLVMMVPVQVTGAGFLSFMIDLNLHNTKWPLIIPAIAAPAIVFFMRSYMKSSFPLEIVEAARIDGSSEFSTFLKIAIPMMKPAIAVQAIFAFIANWNNLYTPQMILLSVGVEKKTLPMMLASLMANDKIDYGVVYVTIALSVVPLIVAYVFLSKFIIAGVALGGVKE
ncbi:MAG: carbohydrate ABC transporter permease [Ruminococcus sp.]|nr:carbohydrate ABC transporter permease [Ruminococcus sp.]